MDDHRKAESAGGEVGRGGNVATEAQHHVGLDPAEELSGRRHRLEEPRPEQSKILTDSTGHRYRGDQLELQPGGRNDGGLQPACGTERGHRDSVAEAAQL